MDCVNIDSSFGSMFLAEDIKIASSGYTWGISATLSDTVDIGCSYISYNGFQLEFQTDSVTQFELYTYVGTGFDVNQGDWGCQFDSANPTNLTTSIVPFKDYKTLRSSLPIVGFENVCAYQLNIFSPKGSAFSYNLYFDGSMDLKVFGLIGIVLFYLN